MNARAAPLFVPASLTPLSAEAERLVTADFNNDGRADVAVSNDQANTVSVLLGDGHGGFAAAPGSPFAVGQGPDAVVAGDFDGDGNADLAVANYTDGTVSVLLGDGHGGFSPAPGSPVAVGSEARSLAVGYFVAGGPADLAVQTSGGVVLLAGDGHGGFSPMSSSPITSSHPTAVLAGYFNGDGNADLAVLDGVDSTVSMFLGDGKGNFTLAPGSPVATGVAGSGGCGGVCLLSGESLAQGDFNADGHPDVAAGFANGQVSVLLGDGHGGLTLAPGSPFAANSDGAQISTLSAGDFNGDGVDDLAAADYFQGGCGNPPCNLPTDAVSLLLSDGHGQFSQAPGSPYTVSGVVPGASIGDFNADGHLDAVAADDYSCRGDALVTLLNQGPNGPASTPPETYGGDGCPISRPHPFAACMDPGSGPHPLVQGIEVTQGVQTDALPWVDQRCAPAALFGGSHPSASYPSGALFNDDGTVNHVALVAGRTTVVRAYADIVGPASSQYQGPVDAVLWAFRNGRPIPAAPGAPNPQPEDGLSRTLSLGGDQVTRADRTDPEGAFQFTIPAAWAQGKITLVAQINPLEQSQGQVCYGCGIDDVFTLRDVVFTPVRPLFIRVASMPVGDQQIGVAAALSRLQSVLPIPESSIRLPNGGSDGTIQVSSSDACNGGLLDTKLADWGSNQTFGGGASVNRVLGLTDQSCQPGATHPAVNGAATPSLPGNDQQASIAAASRPLTSVAHELTHGLGQPHAGRRCPTTAGQPLVDPGSNPSGAEPWPTDDEGLLQGIGLDIHRTAANTFNSYQLISSAPDAQARVQTYDYMSYCVGLTGTDPSVWERFAWVSPRTWDQLVQKLVLPGAHLATAARARVARARAVPSLSVVALPQEGGAQIIDVASRTAPPRAPGPAPYQLTVRDRAGHVLGSVPMVETETHVDFRPDELLLSATVPAHGAAELDVVHGGQVIAQRIRPARAPVVRALAPRRGAVAGRCPRTQHTCTVRVRWRTTNPLRLPLTAVVDFASSAHAAWHTLFVGPDRDVATIPARLLSRAANARVRVRVSDGFNETVAESKPFHSIGAPPAVEILSPIPHERIVSDSAHLEGYAVDDAGRSLRGHDLHWYAGHRQLGTGNSLEAAVIPHRTRRITLVARDRYGRTASATVAVTVHPTPPRFLLINAPASLSPRAAQLRLRIAALAATELTVTGHDARRVVARVGPPARTITVRVRPGHARLRLTLTLHQGQFKSALTVTIAR